MMHNSDSNQRGDDQGKAIQNEQTDPATHVVMSMPVPNTEPPLPYSAVIQAAGIKEDELQQLRRYDTTFLVDDSTSMTYPVDFTKDDAFSKVPQDKIGDWWKKNVGDKHKPSRWNTTRDALAELAEIASKYDEDGIDLFFLNSPVVGQDLKTREDVKRAFESVIPGAGTPTGGRIEDILHAYWRRCPTEKNTGEWPRRLNLVVITDGKATDDVAGPIRRAAKKLDELDAPLSQIGIQFLQIGKVPEATKFLNQIDDELSTCSRDIVDTTPYTDHMNAVTLLKALLGGVNKKVDHQRNAGPPSPSKFMRRFFGRN